mgnify:CR=1 FL=1
MEEEIKEIAFRLREDILKVGEEINEMHRHPVFSGDQASPGQHSEMHANVTLAYRHLEDARMRLGKVVQAYDGGTSCYPR